MQEILDFLESLEDGATEQQLSMHFKKLKRIELVTILNSLVNSDRIEVIKSNDNVFYKNVVCKTISHEDMILDILKQSGSKGLSLREIKMKTTISHTLLLKLLKNFEASRKIKSIKSVKNNRKIYMLYDVKPSDDISGGIWFSNNDVDLEFVQKLMSIILKFCYVKEEEYALPTINSLFKTSDVKEFIENSGISEVNLTINDINMLIDALVYDGKIEKYEIENGTALRCLNDNYLTR